ncbi:hypothetical protein BASA60_009760 [Batrachochytrium salamandrivorans]|nr:hypothetical protein BASA60_009760 [Batrachochytrium salamandrivorans]
MGRRYLEYDRAHGVPSESHASLEVKQLPAGAVAISSAAALSDNPTHLEELAQLHSDEQQSQAVTCRSVPTAAVIPTKIPSVYPIVVIPAAAVKTPILSDTPAPVEKESPSGNTPKKTFLRMLSCDAWSRFGQSSMSTHSIPQGSSTVQPILHLGLEATDMFRLGRRNITSVSNTGLDELRDSTNTVDSGYNSNRSSISSAFDATKLWFKTNMGKKSNVVGATSPPATPLASVDIVSPETLPTGAQDTVVL